ncbi:MAG: hypothetical protein KF764_08580 [Labilithrix sp.]|nr:hypothetical protein [Labilithrix sp.]
MFSPTIRANGKPFTRNSVSVRPNGLLRLTGIDSVNWSDEVAMDLVPGMNDQGMPLGVAVGNYTCAASISFYPDEAGLFENMILALNPLAAGNLSAAVFQLPIVMREDLRVRMVTIVNARIKGRSVSVSNDGSALVQEYQLQPMLVLEDGKSLVSLIPAL